MPKHPNSPVIEAIEHAFVRTCIEYRFSDKYNSLRDTLRENAKQLLHNVRTLTDKRGKVLSTEDDLASAIKYLANYLSGYSEFRLYEPEWFTLTADLCARVDAMENLYKISERSGLSDNTSEQLRECVFSQDEDDDLFGETRKEIDLAHKSRLYGSLKLLKRLKVPLPENVRVFYQTIQTARTSIYPFADRLEELYKKYTGEDDGEPLFEFDD